jgi:dTDP-4-dehydrorhamnose reductase
MAKIVVLGSSGMIGSGLSKTLYGQGHEIIELNRSNFVAVPGNRHFKFEIGVDDLEDLLSQIDSVDLVVNATGVIRHKINENNLESVQNAIHVNSIFPYQFAGAAEKLNLKILQIATDCVFSGATGSYAENSRKDPVDMYGYTKVLGEFFLENVMNIRVSVVGHEIETHLELMDWVLSQPLNASLNGYVNHVWNGTTPIQLAKVIAGIVEYESFVPGTHHLVPADRITKFDLIKQIATYGKRDDLVVLEENGPSSVDRSLSTLDPSRNLQFWEQGGYTKVPQIKEMIEEYFAWAQ